VNQALVARVREYADLYGDAEGSFREARLGSEAGDAARMVAGPALRTASGGAAIPGLLPLMAGLAGLRMLAAAVADAMDSVGKSPEQLQIEEQIRGLILEQQKERQGLHSAWRWSLVVLLAACLWYANMDPVLKVL